jgi:hypothetical protein
MTQNNFLNQLLPFFDRLRRLWYRLCHLWYRLCRLCNLCSLVLPGKTPTFTLFTMGLCHWQCRDGAPRTEKNPKTEKIP